VPWPSTVLRSTAGFRGFFGGGFGSRRRLVSLGFGEPFFPCSAAALASRSDQRSQHLYRNRNVFNHEHFVTFNYVNARNVHAVTVANHDTLCSRPEDPIAASSTSLKPRCAVGARV